MTQKFDFDTLVDRTSTGSLLLSMSPSNLIGEDVIGLAGAEMDFATAPVITNALAKFSRKGIYGFTLQDKPYNDQIIWWMEHSRSCKVSPQEIVVSSGTIFSLGTAIRAFTNVGDGVILQKPVYFRFDNVILRNGRKIVSNPLILNEDGSYSIDFDDLERCMRDENCKMMVLCNPHNPISKVYKEDELREISKLALKHGIVVFSDEIFADVCFGCEAIPFFELSPQNAISSTSLGKTFNFTGVNQSNLFIRNDKIRQAFLNQRLADHFGSIDPFFYQSILAGYSQEGLDWVNAMKGQVLKNVDLLKKNMDFKVSPLEGSFVCWIDFRSLGLNGEDLDEFLIQKALLFLDPGFEYGEEGTGFARMNLACPSRFITGATERLRRAIDEQFTR